MTHRAVFLPPHGDPWPLVVRMDAWAQLTREMILGPAAPDEGVLSSSPNALHSDQYSPIYESLESRAVSRSFFQHESNSFPVSPTSSPASPTDRDLVLLLDSAATLKQLPLNRIATALLRGLPRVDGEGCSVDTVDDTGLEVRGPAVLAAVAVESGEDENVTGGDTQEPTPEADTMDVDTDPSDSTPNDPSALGSTDTLDDEEFEDVVMPPPSAPNPNLHPSSSAISFDPSNSSPDVAFTVPAATARTILSSRQDRSRPAPSSLLPTNALRDVAIEEVQKMYSLYKREREKAGMSGE